MAWTDIHLYLQYLIDLLELNQECNIWASFASPLKRARNHGKEGLTQVG